MKKNKLVSIVLIIMIVSVILLVAKDSLAASGNIIDITNTLTGAGKNNTVNNTTGNNVTTNNTVNNTTNNTVLKTNNTVNNSLPNTGIESSVAGVVLVVVLGISAVYAYNKIQYYRDI